MTDGNDPSDADTATVLIVEDEFLIGMDMEIMLQDCGYGTFGPCDTVLSAMQTLDDNDVDAAVLDLDLRDGSSVPVAKRLRAQDTPFVFSTGRPGRIPEAFTDTPRLTKPCSLVELRRAMSKLLGGGRR